MTGYTWRPIEDLTQAAAADLRIAELTPLVEVWQEQRTALTQAEGLRQFNERLRREWAIETGLLERIYTLDRGVTQLLIEQGISVDLLSRSGGAQDPTRVTAIIRDHEAAIEGLFAFVQGERMLTTSYIKELHAQLTRNQLDVTAIDTLGRSVTVPLLHGEFKRLPNNPQRPDGLIHQYCPPLQVGPEMERLVDLHATHAGHAPEVQAAWLHHRFTQIHPFQDGNGRIARCLATIVFLRAGWFPLTIRDVPEERQRYLNALEAADNGDLAPLVMVLANVQRRAFTQAIGISAQVLQAKRADQIILAARRQLEVREQTVKTEWQQARVLADGLRMMATDRFRDIQRQLVDQMRETLPHAQFRVDEEPEGGRRHHYFRRQIIECAKQLGYFANPGEYHAWTRMVLRASPQAEILVSFHGVGHEFRGVLAASASFFRREETEEGEREIVGLTPLNDDIFQVNYLDTFENAADRFRTWLEDALVHGLELWRQGL